MNLNDHFDIDVRQYLVCKVFSLLTSRRAAAALAAILTVWLRDSVGLSPEDARSIAYALAAWIVGDSISKTGLSLTKELER